MGDLRSGARPSRLTDVARLAGVSAGTVSNVLNNPHLVSDATREKVEAVLHRTGFIRNAAARQLTGALSSTAGCVLLDLANPYFAEVARGVEDGLAEQGCLTITCISDVDLKRERRYLRMLCEHRVRAVILNSVEGDPAGLGPLRDAGIPVVLLDSPRPRDDLCTVSTDGVAGGRLAAEHLLALGHRRIGLLRDGIDLPSLRDRLTGLRHAIEARGLRARDVVTGVSGASPGHRGDPGPAIDAALCGPDPCTAFLCRDDMAALRLLTGLHERGIRVPADVSVIGYDDLEFSGSLSPALTTVSQPAYELGRAAARLAADEGRAGHAHTREIFTPELVVRGSTAPPPGRPPG